MNKKELKKELILDVGMKVMAVRGYNGTSIQDIVNAADVPKGSFYTYFKSKEDFAIAALDMVSEEKMQNTRKLLSDRNIPPMARLVRVFQEKIDSITQESCGGCFIGNMCQEMADSSEAIRLKVRQMLRNKTQMLEDLLEEARVDGSLKSPLSSVALAEFVFNAWEGSLMRMKASKCREPLDTFLTTLPGILGG